MLELIETSLESIRNLLISNNKIKLLLYYTSNNALNLEIPEQSLIENYIVKCPFYNLLEKDAYSKNTVINISLVSVAVDERVESSIKISIISNADVWELINGKIRPIQIANEIIKILNNKKLNASNPISFVNMEQIIYNKQLVGYDLFFNLVDGNGEIDNY